MPIKFVCSRCGNVVLVARRVADLVRPTECPFCGAKLRSVVRIEVRRVG